MIGAAFLLLLVMLVLSLPVAAVLALTGYILSENYAFFPMTGAAGELAWNSSEDFILIAAPMFIMMGELMHRSGVSGRLFNALTPWFARLPGRLMHTNIAASAVFAATSGSSIATAATIGRRPPTIRRMMRCVRRILSRPCSASRTSMPEMSPPEQKVPPAPVMTTARTALSPCAFSSASNNCSRSGTDKALRRAG